MAPSKDFPLSLTIKAVDKATAPLRAINARINKFTAPVRKLGNSFKALSDEMGLPRVMKGFAGVGKGVANVGREAFSLGAKLVGMAGVAGFALFSIVKGAVDAGDKLGEMAQRVGLSVDAYAQLGFAAAQADVDQEQFNSSMDQFNKRLGQLKATGGGPLKELGKGFVAQLKGAKNTQEALKLATKAIGKYTDPAERAALANVFFGKSGLQMGQFLGQGVDEIDKQMARAGELMGPQGELAAGAGAVDNALREMSTAFDGAKNAAVAGLYPAIMALSKAVTDFLVENRDGLTKWAKETGAAIKKWVDEGGIDRLVKGFKEFSSTVSTVVSAIGGLKTVFAGVALVMSIPLITAVLGLIGAVISLNASLVSVGLTLGIVMLPIAAFIAAGIGIAALAITIYKNWGDIKLLFSDLAWAIQDAWGPVKDFFANLWDGITARFVQAWDFIKGIVGKMGGVMNILTNPVGALVQGGVAVAGSLMGAGTSAPALGAAKAAPPSIQSTTTDARVSVDFANVPKGVRVSSDKNVSTDVNYSMGIMSVSP